MYSNFQKLSYIANFTDAVVAVPYLLDLKLSYVVWLLNPGKNQAKLLHVF